MSVVAPPPVAPPGPDELELLIREARERQLRRRLLGAAAVAIVAAIGLSVYGFVTGGSAQGDSGSSGSPRLLASTPCGAAAGWRLRLGPRWSEQTGQQTAPVVLTRVGSTACTLNGYPAIVLRDAAGRVLAFRYGHHGDLMVTGRPPRPVHVGARRSAYFVFDKYRCDIRAQAVARFARVRLPGVKGWLALRLPHYPIIDYCPKEAPSTTIAVTPVVATLAQASARP